MDQKYKNEPLVTLSEARKICGYTSDHLAYLCRSGYLSSERHGRIWLTCGQAIEDYQASLAAAGKPVVTEEQLKILQKSKSAKRSSFYAKIKKSVTSLSSNLGFVFFGPIRSLMRAPSLAQAATPEFHYPDLAQLGFPVGLPPERLPVASLPAYIAPRSIAGHAIGACMSIAILLLFLQGGGNAVSTALLDGIRLTERTASILAATSAEVLQLKPFYTEGEANHLKMGEKSGSNIGANETIDHGKVAGEFMEIIQETEYQKLPIASDSETRPATVGDAQYRKILESPDVLYKIGATGTVKYPYSEELDSTAHP